MKIFVTFFILCAVHCIAESKSQLLGRPDGHEPGIPKADEGKSQLLGRPDGHEPGIPKADEGKSQLLGRPDGHELGIPKANGEPDYIYDSNSDYYDEEEEEEESYYDYNNDEDEHLSDEDSEKPLIRCKRPLCMMHCDNGLAVDSTGCEICECKRLDTDGHKPATDGCGDRMMCTMYCVNGFKTDANGCSICKCKEPDSGLIGRPDGHEPAPAHCRDMPMCLMFCEHGFKTGENGCPVCECNENLLGRPDGHELNVNCKDKPICRMFCELGFKTDEQGCSVCSCLEDPCLGVECEIESECQHQPCEDNKSCTVLSAKCVSVRKPLLCPEPMCANFCPTGYKTNEAGCMTCQCNSVPAGRICGVSVCEEEQVCRNGTDSRPKCTFETICEKRRDQPVGLGGSTLECERDGSFKPLQCNSENAECWCVTGLGDEVFGTRTTVYIEEHKPNCVQNNSVSMHLNMTLVVKQELDTAHLETLNATIVDHVSSWLLIEPHFIKIIKAEAMSADDIDDMDGSYYNDEISSSDDDNQFDSERQLMIEMIVFHDGQSDLPSAAFYLQNLMRQGQCDIQFGDGILLPNPYSLKAEHHFVQPEFYRKQDVTSWKCWRSLRVGLCVTGSALFLLIVVTLSSSIYRRRKLTASQFKHLKLDSQVSVEKNFLNEDTDQLSSDRDVYESNDKLPIA